MWATRLMLCLVVSSLWGCAAAPSADESRPSARLGEEFSLTLGDTVGLADTSYAVTFDRVLEEGRCPAGVTCVWEGNARIAVRFIEFEVWPPGGKTVEVSDEFTVELNTSSRFATAADHGGFHVELRRLGPAPSPGSAPAYTAWLSVSRR